jgi:hypothetical protein
VVLDLPQNSSGQDWWRIGVLVITLRFSFTWHPKHRNGGKMLSEKSSELNRVIIATLVLASATLLILPCAQAQNYKMETPIPPGITTPDKVDTRLGTLKFEGGVRGNRISIRHHLNSLRNAGSASSVLRYLPHYAAPQGAGAAVSSSFNRGSVNISIRVQCDSRGH